MTAKQLSVTLVAFVLGVSSFCLAFLLLLWFGFFIAYFGSPDPDGRWPGPRLHDALGSSTSAGPVSLLVGWGRLGRGRGNTRVGVGC